MAGEAVVGALRVILGMDTSSYEDGAKKAAQTTESFGKKVAEIAAGIGLEKGLEKLGHSFLEFAKGGLEAADSLGKMAQKIGIPVEQLSGLQLAAQLSDVSLQSLGKGIKNLSIDLVKSAAGGATEAASALSALQISAKGADGQLRPMSDILLDISDKFKTMEEGQTKVALASALFGGKLGNELIPFLNQGKVAIVEMMVQAEKFGLVISADTAEKAAQFNDSIKLMNAAVNGISTQLAAAFAPALAAAGQKMVDFVNNNNLAKNAAEILIRAIILVSDNFKILIAVLDIFLARMAVTYIVNFVTSIISLGRAIAISVASFQLLNVTTLVTTARFVAMAAVVLYFSGQLPAFNEAVGKTVDVFAKMLPADTTKTITEGLKAIGLDTSALEKDLKNLVEAAKKHNDNPVKPPKFDPNAAAEAKKFNEEIIKLQIQTRATNQEFANLAPNFVQTAQSLSLIKANGEGLTKTLQLATPEAIRLNTALFNLKAAQFTQDNLTPLEQYDQQMQILNATMLNTNMTQETFTRQSLKNATALRDAYGQVAVSVTSNLASAFKDLAGINKQYAGVAKAAAIAQATAQTYVAANAAFAQGSLINPAFGFVAMGAAIAAGLANVAKISATQFAQGGSFKVGGVGGIDSQLVTMRATPGEMVDVRKPGQATTATEVTVNLNGKNLFSGDMLRDMFSALNSGIRDGYRLKVA